MMIPALRSGFGNAGVKEGSLGEVDDVIAAASYLARQPQVDPDRIYFAGHGSGGTLALLVATQTERFRAVITFGPVEEVTAFREDLYKFKHKNEKDVTIRSPINWLKGIKTPT